MDDWVSLERLWRSTGGKTHIKVRFDDWTYQIKYFLILGESEDGKRLVGILDSGERISFSKRSKGWRLYETLEEVLRPHAV
jgi:hypothetical protein